MEASMYEDNTFSAYTNENVAQRKRKFTLDLNGRAPKKVRTNTAGFNPLLTSPDLKMLKLASPELDELLVQQGGLFPITTGISFTGQTPIKVPTPSELFKSFQPPNSLTPNEFIKGFQDAYEQHQNKDSVIVSVSSNSTVPTSQAIQYTQLEVPQVPAPSTEEAFLPALIKEEPQTVPCGSPPVSPIDMENQEKIKLERKRLRNRIAASKCRKRKLEKISRLEGKVDVLKNENSELQNIVNKLRDQVCGLKQQVMEHVQAGCQIRAVPLATQ